MSPLLSTPHSKWASIRVSCKVGNYYTTRSRTGNLWQTYFVMVNQVIMVTLKPRNYDINLTTRNPRIKKITHQTHWFRLDTNKHIHLHVVTDSGGQLKTKVMTTIFYCEISLICCTCIWISVIRGLYSKWASIRVSCKVGNYYTTRSWRTGNLWQTYFVMVNQVIMVTLRPRNYDINNFRCIPVLSSHIVTHSICKTCLSHASHTRKEYT
jgi:hypothetical protein